MMRKSYSKYICFLMCVVVVFSMCSLEALARDDNPIGTEVPEFPTIAEITSGNYSMINNYGTICAAKSPGEIIYNACTISSLEGATVQENRKDATIVIALNGTINVNNGTIGQITNSAIVKLNAKEGVINQNLNKIEQNMGTVKENHSVIDENRGTIEKVGAAGNVTKQIEGTIGENMGTITVVPDSKGIITEVNIEKNSGTVYIEADNGGSSTVTIKENTNKLVIKNGADCIVENNSGTVEVESGGKCILTGKNTGKMPKNHVVYPEGEYYQLILDNISSTDINMISNYERVGNEIYVLKDKKFTFTIDDSHYSVMWSDDGNIHSASVEDIRKLEDDSIKYVDDFNKTVKLHIHTLGSGTPSELRAGYHEIKCTSCNELAAFEACSGGTATCIECAKCAKCGQEYGSLSTKHSFGEWIIQKEAKIGVEGTKYRKCSVCGFIENNTIPAKQAEEEPKGGREPAPNNNSNGNNSNNKNNNNNNNNNINSNNNNNNNNNNNSTGNNANSNNSSEYEPAKKSGNNGSNDKKDLKRSETVVDKTVNADNTGLQEETQTDTGDVALEIPHGDVQSNDFSEEELASEKEDATDNKSGEVLADDTVTFEEHDSKSNGVVWPIALAGACVITAVSSIAAVRIKKKAK